VNRLLACSALAATVLAAGLAPEANAAPETTAPGQIYVIKVTLSNSKIAIAADRYSSGNSPRYPRGGTVQYSVKNNGSRTYVFKVAGHMTQPIPAGHSTSIQIHWNYRGQYLYELLYNGKPAGPKGYVTVF
jgi:hypothetical protein